MVSQNEFLQGGGFTVEPPTPVPVVEPSIPQEEFLGDQAPSAEEPGIVEQDVEIQQVKQEAAETLDIDPTFRRSMILPFGRNPDGDIVLAVPQFALDVARAIAIPGRAARGEAITGREITEAALEFVGPAAKGLTALRRTTKAGKLTAQQIADAPTSLDLTKASGLKFKGSKQSGAVLKPDEYVGFLAGAERDLIQEGVDAKLHPKLTAVFDAITKKMGQELDATELHKVRRTIGIATESIEPDEARIARVLRDNFDDFVENLPGTAQWVEARGLYIKARKAETVERAIIKASRSGTGLENGLRIQFRSLLNNPRKIRNFSSDEKKAMEAIVAGDFTTNALKKIGRLSFGTGAQSGFLGGTIGVGAGSIIGGPAGAMIAPMVGLAAQKGAQRKTQKAANLLGALVGGVRPEPITKLTDPSLVPRAVGGALVPLEREESQ